MLMIAQMRLIGANRVPFFAGAQIDICAAHKFKLDDWRWARAPRKKVTLRAKPLGSPANEVERARQAVWRRARRRARLLSAANQLPPRRRQLAGRSAWLANVN